MSRATENVIAKSAGVLIGGVLIYLIVRDATAPIWLAVTIAGIVTRVGDYLFTRSPQGHEEKN